MGGERGGGVCPSRTVQTCEAGLRTLEVCFGRGSCGSWFVGVVGQRAAKDRP
jgi:hypothetical protein